MKKLHPGDITSTFVSETGHIHSQPTDCAVCQPTLAAVGWFWLDEPEEEFVPLTTEEHDAVQPKRKPGRPPKGETHA